MITLLHSPEYAMAPVHIRLFGSKVKAGFPSPAEDFCEGRVSLDGLVVRKPAATFFVRVSGDSMEGAGIYDNDILVVDRSVEPYDGRVVVAVVDGETTVKRLSRRNGRVCLMPENPNYEPIIISESTDFSIWGVVTAVLHWV